MEEKLYEAKENFAKRTELPRDVILDLPQITVTGDNEINIENHKGIVKFEKEEVKINSKVGVISIYGYNFEILFIGGSTVTLSGKFKSIVYEGDE